MENLILCSKQRLTKQAFVVKKPSPKSSFSKRYRGFYLVIFLVAISVLVNLAWVSAAEKPLVSRLLISWFSPAQRNFRRDIPAFVRKDKNIIIHSEAHDLKTFYRSLDSLSNRLKNKVNIVHIGDSHVQADVFPGQIRLNLQKDSSLGNGGRGMVFPHSIIGSNNGNYLKASRTGLWRGCRNAEWAKSCNCGITGVTAFTADVTATFSVNPNLIPELTYPVTQIRIFYPVNSPNSFVPKILTPEANIVAQRTDQTGGYVEFTLRFPVPEIKIGFGRISHEQTGFTLQGISLGHDNPGVQYHTMGINGVDATGFLRTPQFEPHLAAQKPDLVIISLGTNDAYVRKFDALVFKRNMGAIIQHIKRATPKTAILLTTPGDGMYGRRYLNYYNAAAGKIIKELAEETGCAVWDFYEVMGGLRSVNIWYAQGFALADRLHLSHKGYILQGDLLYQALMEDYVVYGSRFPMKKLTVTGKK
jgi:lysophospholipase L1-like esterase